MSEKRTLTLAVLVLALSHVASAWREFSKPCAQGCEANGNCNHELGLCECNFGWTGETCATLTLGACRTSDAAGVLPMYGSQLPKSCECFRQIFKHGEQQGQHQLPGQALLGRGTKFCFEREGLAPEKQLSDPPLLNESGVVWRNPSANFVKQAAPARLEMVGRNSELLPLQACPDRCHDRGICLGGSCLCSKGYGGQSCEGPSILCLNKCSGNGECLGGFCKCKAGHWGMDCSRAKAYEPDPANIAEVNDTAYSRTGLRIYRMELPWHVAFAWELHEGNPTYNSLYGAFEKFFNRFSPDWTVRTENPGEANLFYIPAMVPRYVFGDDRDHVRRVLEYVSRTYPGLWARNQGKDFFLWQTGDLGSCWLYDEPLLQNPIKVVHWGLQVNIKNYTSQPNYHWAPQQPVNKQYSCFKYEKDVVAATNSKESTGETQKYWEDALQGAPRKYLLAFSGSIRPEQFEYSGGARQAFAKHVLERKDPRVVSGNFLYSDSVFCFTPYGDGWGSRLTMLVLGACIPVIVQDFVHQPYDDVLPYANFSLRLRVKDMPHLLDILSAMPQEEVQAYRYGLFQYYKAFYWEPDGEAYKYTLASLRRKLLNLWSFHY